MNQLFDITKVREYSVPGVHDVHHISFHKKGRLWYSDKVGNLVLLDEQRGEPLIIPTTDGEGWAWYGFHTVTQGGDLFYIDRTTSHNIIKKRTQNNRNRLFIETGEWRPLSLYSSRISEDILVGMRKGRQGKVVRYTIDGGIEKQIIRLNEENDHLYLDPHYITENTNGDVCVSDISLNDVVVVNKFATLMFTYKYKSSKEFKPYGVCAYKSDTIFVCNERKRTEKIHVLTHEGKQLDTFSCYLSLRGRHTIIRSPSELARALSHRLYCIKRKQIAVSSHVKHAGNLLLCTWV